MLPFDGLLLDEGYQWFSLQCELNFLLTSKNCEYPWSKRYIYQHCPYFYRHSVAQGVCLKDRPCHNHPIHIGRWVPDP